MGKRVCSICSHSDCAAIDAQLAAGMFQSDIAENFQVSRFAVSRHARHSAPAVPESDVDSLEAQATMWRERADALWQQATADADSRAMAQAVSAGLRSVELQARQKEREAEAASDADTEAGAIDISRLDRLFENRGSELVEQIAAFVARRAQNRRTEDELLISQKH